MLIDITGNLGARHIRILLFDHVEQSSLSLFRGNCKDADTGHSGEVFVFLAASFYREVLYETSTDCNDWMFFRVLVTLGT